MHSAAASIAITAATIGRAETMPAPLSSPNASVIKVVVVVVIVVVVEKVVVPTAGSLSLTPVVSSARRWSAATAAAASRAAFFGSRQQKLVDEIGFRNVVSQENVDQRLVL